MPALSPTMSAGNIAKWRVKEGDVVAPGLLYADVETDKATIEWESQEDGFIAKLLVADGAQNIEIGAPVLVIVEESSSIAAFKDWTPGVAGSSPAASSSPAAAAPAAAAPKAGSFPPHTVLTMPALSPTMSTGNILEWTKKVGDAVAPGDIYCEVETDKATIGWDSQEEGWVAALLAPSHSKDVVIGTPMIVIVEDKTCVELQRRCPPTTDTACDGVGCVTATQESLAAFRTYTAADAQTGPKPAAAADAPSPPPTHAPVAVAAAAHTAPAASAAHTSPTPSGARIPSSPYAKKLAAEAGFDIALITSGTGPDGRITAADVTAAVASKKSAPPAAAAVLSTPRAAAASPPADAAYADIPHTQIKRITAARLLESKQTVPHYYLTMEVQTDAMSKLREQINAGGGPKISVNDFVIKAAALALKKVPGVNASWSADFTRVYSNVDVSVAVQTPLGLMVPIVRDADRKGLASISGDVKALAAKAKEGKLAPSEFTGGTFTISNLGMFGVKQFSAIINPPQAAILAVGGSDKKVVVTKAGTYEQVSVMMVTLSCDHRVIDGAMGAEWLQAFKGYIEGPYTMLL
ncbi:MAG: hypothetical protein WDW36_007414 [Sanguina aurantia]